MQPQVRWIKIPQSLRWPKYYIKARPIRNLGNGKAQYTVTFEQKQHTINISHQQSYEASDGKQYQDMRQMSILNEPQILHNLAQRFKKDQIYTLIGSTLISMNPYKDIGRLYSQDLMVEMQKKDILSDKKELPHIFFITNKAFKLIAKNKQNQAILVSGQSGAGKTESTKHCLRFLTSLSNRKHNKIGNYIQQSNIILEAFGNCKTLKNDNSSRFGKFIKLHFDYNFELKGASIRNYLLQKSRVVSGNSNERSFHIFYAIIAAGIENLQRANAYKYLSKSGCYTVNNKNERDEFNKIDKSLNDIGFSTQQKTKIWKTLAAILLLGNIEFQFEEQQKPCTIINPQLIGKVADKINVSQNYLIKLLLYSKKIQLGQQLQVVRKKQQCIQNRDNFSKQLYYELFKLIFSKIEQTIRPQKEQQKHFSISILDIFGFQNFKQNSFEQLCINYTNEKLLKLYSRYVFERQIEYFKADGLQERIQDIVPPNNNNIINLISESLCLFAIINDWTPLPQFDDQHIIHGFKQASKKPQHTNFRQYMDFHKMQKNKFVIKHSQADVWYNILGFKNKNQFKVSEQIQVVIDQLFGNKNIKQIEEPKIKQKKEPTILTKFNEELKLLIDQLQTLNCHFVRCIKPNEQKRENYIDQKYILKQVKYLSVLQTIRISKQTYPFRKSFHQFLRAYKILFKKHNNLDERQQCKIILEEICKNQKDFMIGRQRVYALEPIQNQLNQRKTKFNNKLEKIIRIPDSKIIQLKKSIFFMLKQLITSKNQKSNSNRVNEAPKKSKQKSAQIQKIYQQQQKRGKLHEVPLFRPNIHPQRTIKNVRTKSIQMPSQLQRNKQNNFNIYQSIKGFFSKPQKNINQIAYILQFIEAFLLVYDSENILKNNLINKLKNDKSNINIQERKCLDEFKNYWEKQLKQLFEKERQQIQKLKKQINRDRDFKREREQRINREQAHQLNFLSQIEYQNLVAYRKKIQAQIHNKQLEHTKELHLLKNKIDSLNYQLLREKQRSKWLQDECQRNKKQIKRVQEQANNNLQKEKDNLSKKFSQQSRYKQEYIRIQTKLELMQENNKKFIEMYKEKNKEIMEAKLSAQNLQKQLQIALIRLSNQPNRELLQLRNAQLNDLRQQYQGLQKQFLNLQNAKVSENISNLFKGDILQKKPEKKKELIQMIEQSIKKKIARTEYLYKLDLLNPTSFRRYIDHSPNILLLIQLDNNYLLGGFSLGSLAQLSLQQKKYSTQFGILFSLTNSKKFPLKPDQKSLIYDPKSIVFGNRELTILQNNKIYSNFEYTNLFFDTRGEKVNTFLGMGTSKQAVPKSYEFYSLAFDSQ